MCEFRLDKQGKFVWCSDACVRRLMGSKAHIKGERFDRFVSLKDGEDVLHALVDAVSGSDVVGVRMHIIPYEGPEFLASVTLKPEFGKDGRVTEIAGCFKAIAKKNAKEHVH